MRVLPGAQCDCFSRAEVPGRSTHLEDIFLFFFVWLTSMAADFQDSVLCLAPVKAPSEWERYTFATLQEFVPDQEIPALPSSASRLPPTCRERGFDAPPASGWRPACCGWFVTADSDSWLSKPGDGVYYHMPTSSLWKDKEGNLVPLDLIYRRAVGAFLAQRHSTLLHGAFRAWAQRAQVTSYWRGRISIMHRDSFDESPSRDRSPLPLAAGLSPMSTGPFSTGRSSNSPSRRRRRSPPVGLGVQHPKRPMVFEWGDEDDADAPPRAP